MCLPSLPGGPTSVDESTATLSRTSRHRLILLNFCRAHHFAVPAAGARLAVPAAGATLAAGGVSVVG
eukprot:CAMPEP_0184270060 /NCGR_PEP_ID=MMETSP0977-20130417/36253_1 /TAXON_ID=483370 /ORGANISM="non described non described, Strain CCMP2097" /LENGTH=66 /DNA_ID=CAMNT_0026575889 /DNA_START=1 /DNA_END=197 /DNA_ORIENTATION=+